MFKHSRMVRTVGLEPTRDCSHMHLKHARLPFRHVRKMESVYLISGLLSMRWLYLSIAKLASFPNTTT